MLPKKDNRHFSRECYYKMAKEIIRQCPETINVRRKSIYKQMLEEMCDATKRKICKIGCKMGLNI